MSAVAMQQVGPTSLLRVSEQGSGALWPNRRKRGGKGKRRRSKGTGKDLVESVLEAWKKVEGGKNTSRYEEKKREEEESNLSEGVVGRRFLPKAEP